MTRQEFLDYASGQPLFDIYHKLYSESDLIHIISQHYRSGSNPQKIIDFFMGIGDVEFERTEEASKDILRISLLYSAGSNYYWNDTDCAVQYVGTISNCAGTIEILYISEQGKFYNQNHKLIAENEEDFFGYLTTVEFDFHPEIRQHTYDMLRHVGWHEGRRVDMTEFDLEMKRRGIVLTKAQLDFLSEFSNLDFIFEDDSWSFWSLNSIAKNYKPLFIGSKQRRKALIVGENIFQCGNTMGQDIYLCENGLLATTPEHPLGRTTMECVNHLCNYIHDNAKWLDEEDDGI